MSENADALVSTWPISLLVEEGTGTVQYSSSSQYIYVSYLFLAVVRMHVHVAVHLQYIVVL